MAFNANRSNLNNTNLDESCWKTSKTLLGKIKDQHDEKSWEDFVFYYRDYIYGIVMKMNLKHYDADDITQRVLIKLWKTLPQFEYQPEKGRFRGWLCRITGNEVKDYLRRVKRSKTVSSEDTPGEMAVSMQKISIPEIEQIAETEWRHYVAKLGWQNIVGELDVKTSKCFLMFTSGVPAAEISKELGIAESSVYVYKKRAQDKLREEIMRLNGQLL